MPRWRNSTASTSTSPSAHRRLPKICRAHPLQANKTHTSACADATMYSKPCVRVSGRSLPHARFHTATTKASTTWMSRSRSPSSGKRRGKKDIKMIYAKRGHAGPLQVVKNKKEDRRRFVLNNKQIIGGG